MHAQCVAGRLSPHLVYVDDKGEYARQMAPLHKLPREAHTLIGKLRRRPPPYQPQR